MKPDPGIVLCMLENELAERDYDNQCLWLGRYCIRLMTAEMGTVYIDKERNHVFKFPGIVSAALDDVSGAIVDWEPITPEIINNDPNLTLKGD